MVGESYDEIAGKYVTEQYADDPNTDSRDRFVKLLPEGARVLDAGCGGGQDSAAFDAAGFNIIGVDSSIRMVELSAALVPTGTFIHGGLLDVELEWGSFDGVWCARVFHHVPIAEQGEFVKRLHRLLKPGGSLYLSVKLGQEEHDDETWNLEEGGTKTLVKTLGAGSWPAILSDNGFEVIEKRAWEVGDWVEAYAVKKTA